LVAGGAAMAAAAAYRLVRGRALPPPEPESAPDPRAGALRQKLAESRDVLREQEEFEAAETPIDAVEDVEERRQAVHERGHQVAKQMRREET
jgi:hypothetical protein